MPTINDDRPRDAKLKAKLFTVEKSEKAQNFEALAESNIKRQVWTKADQAQFIVLHRRYGN
jgi:hypothetical protein